jgi:cobalt-zinc-cadmium efflux system outer membrane protein
VRGEIAESKHRERELSAANRDLQAQIAQDVRAAYASASTSLRQAVYLRDELLPSAREAYRVASVSYSLGGSSALDVLDAQRSLIDAQTQFADALAAANSARADLSLAVGRSADAFDVGRTP